MALSEQVKGRIRTTITLGMETRKAHPTQEIYAEYAGHLSLVEADGQMALELYDAVPAEEREFILAEMARATGGQRPSGKPGFAMTMYAYSVK